MITMCDDDDDDKHDDDDHNNSGDEVYVYAYTGTWTADWPHNHFTQFLGEAPQNLGIWASESGHNNGFAGILLRPDYQRWEGPPRRREDQE